MKAVAFTPAAEADLSQIWDYSATKWGVAQADSYVDKIRDACFGLARGTRSGRPVEALPDFQKCLCGSHVVYFLNHPDSLNVIRILHMRQDADRHL